MTGIGGRPKPITCICQGGWNDCSCLKSATAIHLVAESNTKHSHWEVNTLILSC